MPFLSEAPGGKLTVSTTDVVETNIGSDISDLAIDFFRRVPTFGIGGGTAFGLNLVAIGVPGFDTGGVLLAEKGIRGEGWGWKALKLGLWPPGDGRGETGRPGDICEMPTPPGERRGVDPLLTPFAVWSGCKCFDSK